jgi:hypothetical protein
MPAKTCFVICPFGAPDSDIRSRSDMVLEYVIKPAVVSAGYEIYRADLAAQPGIVTVHVIQHLIEDDLVVADITDRNPNVFYELAIRHAIRKPYVQIISHGQLLPFNIQEVQTVVYDIADVKGIRAATELIQKQLQYYEAGGKVTSPVTVAIDAMLGTHTISQFAEIAKKLEDLDHSIGQTAGLGTALQEIREQLLKVSEDVKQRADYAAGQSSSTSDGDSGRRQPSDSYGHKGQQPTRISRKEYTLSEWMDLNQRGKV